MQFIPGWQQCPLHLFFVEEKAYHTVRSRVSYLYQYCQDRFPLPPTKRQTKSFWTAVNILVTPTRNKELSHSLFSLRLFSPCSLCPSFLVILLCFCPCVAPSSARHLAQDGDVFFILHLDLHHSVLHCASRISRGGGTEGSTGGARGQAST